MAGGCVSAGGSSSRGGYQALPAACVSVVTGGMARVRAGYRVRGAVP